MIFLALRYLLDRKRQTLLTLLGVFLGTMAYVAVSGFFLGFQGFMVDQLVNNSAQIHVQAREDALSDHDLDAAFFGPNQKVDWVSPPEGVQGFRDVQDAEGWYARMRADPRVVAFSPQKTAPVFFTIANRSVSATMTGCDPAMQANVTSVATYMTDGHFSDIAAGGARLIVGAELMRRLGVGVGQTVLAASGGESIPFKIVGKFATGNRGADMQAYAALSDVQRLTRSPRRINEIAVRLADYTQAGALARSWGKLAPELVESWDQQFANVLSMFAIQTALRFAMIATILIVAGFGIYNILNMTVNQKRKDVAILRSMGYDTFDIVVLFFSQGLIVGMIGGSLGLVAGYGLCRLLQTISFSPAMANNPGGTLHIALDPWIYAQGMAVALLAVALASILPARAAGRLTPIEIIRAGG